MLFLTESLVNKNWMSRLAKSLSFMFMFFMLRKSPEFLGDWLIIPGRGVNNFAIDFAML